MEKEEKMNVATNEIVISNISYQVKSKKILKDVSFAVKQSEVFALLGINGSGKSTLIDIILNDLTPSSGTVSFNDKYNKYRSIGVVYDHLPMFPMLKVSETIQYFASIYKLRYTDVKQLYFDIFEIERIKDSFIRELSHGEKKRIGLLLSIIQNPQMLIMDEPFANLDPPVIDTLWKVLKQGERTVFFTTHNWKKVEDIATKIAFLYDGKIILPPQSPRDIFNSLSAEKKIVVALNDAIIDKLENKTFYIHDNDLNIFYNEDSTLLSEIKKHTSNFSIQNIEIKDAYLFWTKKNSVC